MEGPFLPKLHLSLNLTGQVIIINYLLLFYAMVNLVNATVFVIWVMVQG